jgi:RNA polymerase sigma factor (sigma-70 family)
MVFGSFKRMNEVHSMEVEDFLQIGRTSVYEATKRYKPGTGKAFSSFAFMVIKQKIIECVQFLEREKRDQRNEVKEIETEEGLNILDIMPSYINVERHVINKVTIENLLNQLNGRQRQVVELFIQGYTGDEIAERLGSGSTQSVNMSYHRAIKRMRKGA